MIISWISGIESALEGAWGCVQAFENESPSARLFIRYDLPASTATATPGTRWCHEPARCRRRFLPSPPPPPPSPPLRRKLAATPEEALYLTANNRTIFHVTALARLATSTRRVCPPSFCEEAKGNRGWREVIVALVVNHGCRMSSRSLEKPSVLWLVSERRHMISTSASSDDIHISDHKY